MATVKKYETAFTDARGRLWQVDFDDDAIHRLALSGLDIFAVMKMKLYDETAGFDPEVIVKRIHCLWSLLAPQAKAAGITAADFTEAIDPRPDPENTKAHFAAWRAVLQAMVNRSPNPCEVDDSMLADDSSKAQGDVLGADVKYEGVNMGQSAMRTVARMLTVATAALGSLLVFGALQSEGQIPVQRAVGPRLKTSLNAYSFNKPLSDHLKGTGKGMSLFELLDFCAEQNFDAIDPTGYYFPGYPKPPSNAYLNDFKRRAFVLGLDISGTGVRTHFAEADKVKRAKDIQHVKEWVEVAARMGAPVLRVFAGAHPEGHSWDEVAEWMTADLKTCVEHGKKHGVIIGIQNHDDFLKTGAQTVKIVKMVDSEWFGVVVDTGAFATPDPYKDIAMVAPFAVNWQIKTHMPGKGARMKTDFKRIVQIAREANYRGYLPIETLPVAGEAYDPLIRVPQALKEWRAALRPD